MALFDPYGRIIEKPPSKPLTDMIGTVRVRDQWSTYPSVKLTPEKLATILKEADAGDIIRQSELAEEMEEKDPLLFGALQTAKLALQKLKIKVTPASNSAEDKKIADHVIKNFQDLDLDDLVLDMSDAIFKGCAFSELNWGMDGGSTWLTGVEWIHQKRFTFTEFSADWNARLPKMPRLLTDDDPLRGIDLVEKFGPAGAFKIVYHRYKARSGFPQRAGLVRTVSLPYLLNNYTWKDWIIFIEKFGQPMRLGIFEPGAGKDDIAVLKEAIQNLGTDAGAVISSLTKIDFPRVEGVTAHADVYERAAKWFTRTYEIAILGQTATTEGTPGQLGNQDAQADVRSDLNSARANAIAKTIRQQIVWPMVGFNFGFDKALPNVSLPVKEPKDQEKVARVFTALADGGAEITLRQVNEEFGIDAREGDEPVLKARAPAANPFGQPPIAALQLKKKVSIPIA